MNKNDIRAKIKKRLCYFSPQELSEKNDRIIATVCELLCYRSAESVMCYVSFGGEVQTHGLIQGMFQDDKKVYVPRCQPDEHLLDAVRIFSFADLHDDPQPKGMREPKTHCQQTIAAEALDLIIVPILAFDEDGTRLGYGGGFYDRFLFPVKPEKILGIAFDFQCVESIDRDTHDIRIPTIVTESRVIVS